MDDIYNGQQKKSEFYYPEVEKMGRGGTAVFFTTKKKISEDCGGQPRIRDIPD